MSSLSVIAPTFPLTRAIVEEIVRIGAHRAPSEACGVILPPPGDRSGRAGIAARVIELPNRSKRPRDSYELHGKDLVLELEDWLLAKDNEDRERMIFWHTHPSGNIGPSRGDLGQKNWNFSFLVVSIDPHTGHHTSTFF